MRFNGVASMTAQAHIVGGAGWQWVTRFAKVTTRGDSAYAILFDAPPGDVWIYAPTLIYLPPATGDNDAYEWFNTFCAQPLYLPKGLSGTMDGEIFVAHKGIGSVEETVTLGAANGSSIKAYDPEGNFLGYIELKDEA
jgi:hypothetical protein